jgi:hypothetical protein
MRWIPRTSGELALRDRWKSYSDCFTYLRDTNEISEADKEQLFAKTIRRVLRREPEKRAPDDTCA